jgi:hypothetical protein
MNCCKSEVIVAKCVGAMSQYTTRHIMDDTNASTRAAVQVRLEGPLYQALEDWRRSQPRIPARSEALRELLERALAEHSDADGKASGPLGAALYAIAEPKAG